MTNCCEQVLVWGGTLRADAARGVREQRARAGEGPERQVGTWESGAGCSAAGGRDSRPGRVPAPAGEAPELRSGSERRGGGGVV